ncbi:DNAJ protein [Arcobacter nitrofigilis DSM 7299]|uniref:DNAJ protein n=1 Tax=Arcobacter nitrofigilis (strain ATCC 33309 / DSM 7299 / CCUG 15893 / LMG 7604 / NCTC 12251 / CI) TaxID=572480 RepID=D5V4B2_ARCNC|nr:hypothetical protein [Arcobacter nitrofigilis]ADG91845.1 DNAJ protein [Arcobacter nitrofigilis DSM 7299]
MLVIKKLDKKKLDKLFLEHYNDEFREYEIYQEMKEILSKLNKKELIEYILAERTNSTYYIERFKYIEKVLFDMASYVFEDEIDFARNEMMKYIGDKYGE